MRLRAVKTRPDLKRKKPYVRYDVTIPPDFVETLGWKPGDELVPVANGPRLTLHPVRLNPLLRAKAKRQEASK